MITSSTYIVSDAALFTSPPPNRLPPFLSTLFPDPDEDELAIFALFPVPVPVAIGPVIDSALSRFAFFRDLGSLEGSRPWIGVGIGEGVEVESWMLEFYCCCCWTSERSRGRTCGVCLGRVYDLIVADLEVGRSHLEVTDYPHLQLPGRYVLVRTNCVR